MSGAEGVEIFCLILFWRFKKARKREKSGRMFRLFFQSIDANEHDRDRRKGKTRPLSLFLFLEDRDDGETPRALTPQGAWRQGRERALLGELETKELRVALLLPSSSSARALSFAPISLSVSLALGCF